MKTIVGVMGAGKDIDGEAYDTAYALGRMVAEHGWALLTGGSASGVMDAASKGAHDANGLVIGVLKGDEGSEYLDIAIKTGMGDARNIINVLSSDVVIALPGGAGTISEVALGLVGHKTVITLGWDAGAAMHASGEGLLLTADTAEEAIALVRQALERIGR